MNIGLLVLLNLGTTPFLSEFEHIACELKVQPRPQSVLALKNFRKQRWAWGFGVLWLLFLALALAPTASGKSYPVTGEALTAVLLLQLGLWRYAFRRAKRSLANK